MTKKVQWSYTPCPVLWVLSGLWLVGWASRGSLAVTGSQVTDALLTRFTMFAVHSLTTRGILSQWGHGQRAWRRGNNRLLGLLYSPMRPFVCTWPSNVTQSYFWLTMKLRNSLTFCLANKVLQLKVPVDGSHCNTSACEKQHEWLFSHRQVLVHRKEADTLIMLHTAEISKAGKNVHIMTQDTDVMVLALQRLTVLGLQTTMLMGTGDNRRKNFDETNICPSWDIKSWSTSGISLFNRMWHMWTYCKGIGKKTAFKACIEATPAELTALSQLGVEEMPSADVVLGCERFFVQAPGHKQRKNKNKQTNKQTKRPTGQHSWKIEVEALSEPTWGDR